MPTSLAQKTYVSRQTVVVHYRFSTPRLSRAGNTIARAGLARGYLVTSSVVTWRDGSIRSLLHGPAGKTAKCCSISGPESPSTQHGHIATLPRFTSLRSKTFQCRPPKPTHGPRSESSSLSSSWCRGLSGGSCRIRSRARSASFMLPYAYRSNLESPTHSKHSLMSECVSSQVFCSSSSLYSSPSEDPESFVSPSDSDEIDVPVPEFTDVPVVSLAGGTSHRICCSRRPKTRVALDQPP